MLELTQDRAGAVLTSVLTDLEKAVATVPSEHAPALLGELERVKAVLWARIMRESLQPTTPALGEEVWLTIPQVAERLGIPIQRAYELARHQGGLPTIRLGRSLRVSPTELTAWLGQQKKGLDKRLSFAYSRSHDRTRTTPHPKTPGSDAKGTRRGSGGDGQLYRTAGAGRNGHQGTACSVGAGVSPTGTEK